MIQTPKKLLSRNQFLSHSQGSTLNGMRTMTENNVGEAMHRSEDKGSWCTNGGDKHDWKQWHEYVKHCRKYRCKREGCGFFKKCWIKCEDIDCKGCHVIGHKRW